MIGIFVLRSGRVNCCWCTPAQSFLLSETRGTQDHILLLHDTESWLTAKVLPALGSHVNLGLHEDAVYLTSVSDDGTNREHTKIAWVSHSNELCAGIAQSV
jgi:hypothetical protein